MDGQSGERPAGNTAAFRRSDRCRLRVYVFACSFCSYYCAMDQTTFLPTRHHQTKRELRQTTTSTTTITPATTAQIERLPFPVGEWEVSFHPAVVYGLVSFDCKVCDRILIMCLPNLHEISRPVSFGMIRSNSEDSAKNKIAGWNPSLWCDVSKRVVGGRDTRDTRSWVGSPVKSRVFTGPWLGRCVAYSPTIARRSMNM